MTPEYMSDILSRIAQEVGSTPDDLAVTVASRTGDSFRVLVSTILSLRTRDEVTAVATPRLLQEAPSPQKMLGLSEERISELIYPTSFYRMKSRTLRGISQSLLDHHEGKVPDTIEGLLTLKGIGRKSANLILTLGFGKPGICVDTHVHRISNRLGFVKTNNPTETEFALRASLPEHWWIDINGTLIAFGRTICNPISPKCSSCCISGKCPKVGVSISR